MLAKAIRKYVNLKTVENFNCLRFLDLIKCWLSSIVISVARVAVGIGLNWKRLYV